MSEAQDLPAGDFSVWLGEMKAALGGERAAAVPCDGCTACCTSSQFVHIGPEEADTLARIPRELLFPAPRLPHGHVVLGYDERGHCPMLSDGNCSIYEHRPRACRTYDCRVFAAAGLDAAADDKPLIAERARRWRFNYPTETDRREHGEVRDAAKFILEHQDELPTGTAPNTTTQAAVLAVEMHDAGAANPEE
jgi:Fe-S-cluster containining protein